MFMVKKISKHLYVVGFVKRKPVWYAVPKNMRTDQHLTAFDKPLTNLTNIKQS